MKTNLLKYTGFFILFSLIGIGCTMDEFLYGVRVENENGVLKRAVKGVEISFCLLNEKGIPANVFKEGENFSFLFQIKNNTQEALPFYDYGFYNTYDFFAVRSGSNYVGKPMKFLRLDPSAQTREIAADETATFLLPWHETRDEFIEMYGYFKGLQQPMLAKGKYSTKFTYNFRFAYPDQETGIETGKMTFIINFEVN